MTTSYSKNSLEYKLVMLVSKKFRFPVEVSTDMVSQLKIEDEGYSGKHVKLSVNGVVLSVPLSDNIASIANIVGVGRTQVALALRQQSNKVSKNSSEGKLATKIQGFSIPEDIAMNYAGKVITYESPSLGKYVQVKCNQAKTSLAVPYRNNYDAIAMIGVAAANGGFAEMATGIKKPAQANKPVKTAKIPETGGKIKGEVTSKPVSKKQDTVQDFDIRISPTAVKNDEVSANLLKDTSALNTIFNEFVKIGREAKNLMWSHLLPAKSGVRMVFGNKNRTHDIPYAKAPKGFKEIVDSAGLTRIAKDGRVIKVSAKTLKEGAKAEGRSALSGLVKSKPAKKVDKATKNEVASLFGGLISSKKVETKDPYTYVGSPLGEGVNLDKLGLEIAEIVAEVGIRKLSVMNVKFISVDNLVSDKTDAVDIINTSMFKVDGRGSIKMYRGDTLEVKAPTKIIRELGRVWNKSSEGFNLVKDNDLFVALLKDRKFTIGTLAKNFAKESDKAKDKGVFEETKPKKPTKLSGKVKTRAKAKPFTYGGGDLGYEFMEELTESVNKFLTYERSTRKSGTYPIALLSDVLKAGDGDDEVVNGKEYTGVASKTLWSPSKGLSRGGKEKYVGLHKFWKYLFDYHRYKPGLGLPLMILVDDDARTFDLGVLDSKKDTYVFGGTVVDTAIVADEGLLKVSEPVGGNYTHKDYKEFLDRLDLSNWVVRYQNFEDASEETKISSIWSLVGDKDTNIAFSTKLEAEKHLVNGVAKYLKQLKKNEGKDESYRNYDKNSTIHLPFVVTQGNGGNPEVRMHALPISEGLSFKPSSSPFDSSRVAEPEMVGNIVLDLVIDVDGTANIVIKKDFSNKEDFATIGSNNFIFTEKVNRIKELTKDVSLGDSRVDYAKNSNVERLLPFAYISEAVSVLDVNSVGNPGKDVVEAELITLFYDLVTSGDSDILSGLSTATDSADDSYIDSNFILDSEGLTFGFSGSDLKRKITRRELDKVVQEYELPKQRVSGSLFVSDSTLVVTIEKVAVDLYGIVSNTVKFEGQRDGNAIFTVTGENLLTGNKKTITVNVDAVIGDNDYQEIVSTVLQDLGGLLFEKASYAIESNAGVAWVVENSIISDYLGVNDENLFEEALEGTSIEKEFVFSVSSDGYNANAKLRYGDADTLGVGIENGTTNFVDGKYLYRTRGHDFLDRFGEGGLVTVEFDFLGKTGEEAIKELSLYADESNSLVSIVRGTATLNEETYKEVLNSLSRIGAVNSDFAQRINEKETSGWFSNGTLATALRRFIKVQEMLGETGTYRVGSRLEGDVVTLYIKKD